MKKKSFEIPLRKVILPELEETQKYLKEIDEAKIYSNYGPLVKKLEKRLAQLLHVSPQKVVAVANCTSGLTSLLIQIRNQAKTSSYARTNNKICLMPSYTFVASAMSAILAGFRPVFLDVDDNSCSLTPEIVEEYIYQNKLPLNEIAAVMPVSFFGSLLNNSGWVSFKAKWNIPVVLDVAWSIDNFKPDKNLPAALSLHATKALGCGEGGVTITESEDTSQILRSIINFGLTDERISQSLGFNGKMSEYSAAIALAALDNWPTMKEEAIVKQKYYLSKMENLKKFSIIEGFDTKWVWGALPVKAEGDLEFIKLSKFAELRGIEVRAWWKEGLHKHPIFKNSSTGTLTNTEEITPKIFNIPFFTSLSYLEIDRIIEMLLDYESQF